MTARSFLICTVVLAGLGVLAATVGDAHAQCNSRQRAKLTAPDGAAGDWYGDRVAIDGDVVVVGTDGDDDAGNQSGSAYVYRYDGSAWVLERKLVASDATANARFGISVAVSGDVVVVGADQDDQQGDNAGAAYVFRYDGSTWVQEQKLTASDGEYWDWFGWPVAIDGDVVVVGASGQEDGGGNYYNSGAGYVFRHDGTSWVEEAKLTAFDPGPGDRFGYAAAIDGDVLIFATPHDDEEGARTGAGYAFRYNGSSWDFEQKLVASDAHRMDQFGYSVDVEGDVAVFGAWGESRNFLVFAGAAYVFTYNGSAWRQVDKLTAPDAEGNDHFGNCVSISGDMILVGARYDNVACPTSQNCNSGSAFAFQHNGHGRWLERSMLYPSDRRYFDNFGQYVALDNGRAVIGALLDDDNGEDSGSAYVFTGVSDCDGNQTLDYCEIAWDPNLDADDNGVIDACEWVPTAISIW
jgi:hypothetical protein